jgi:LEA14-like dessication related protein
MSKIIRAIVVGLLSVALSACAMMRPDLQAPELSLVSASLASADIFSQQFNLRLQVENPNDRDLPVKGIDYKLFLEGDAFAEGMSTAPFVVPARGETEFDLSVRTNFMSSIGRLLSRIERNDSSRVRYALSGEVLVDIPFVGAIPFNETGTVDLGTFR